MGSSRSNRPDDQPPRITLAMATVTVSTRTGLADVSAKEWDSLTARPPASLIGSRHWLTAALATVDRGTTPHLVTVEFDGRLVGVLTLVLDERGSEPVLRFAGAPFNDLTDLMALPGHELAAASAALEELPRLARRRCRVRLEDVDPEGALVRADRNIGVLAWAPHTGAPAIELAAQRRFAPSRRRRKRWDRALRALRAERDVHFRLTRGEPMLRDVAEFVRVRDRRLVALGRDRHDPPVDLLHAALEALAPLGRCGFMEMLVDGVAVARDLYLLDRDVAMLWLRALDMRWVRFSCGHLLLRESLARLAGEGFEVLDLGRGDEPYKFTFGANPRQLLTGALDP